MAMIISEKHGFILYDDIAHQKAHKETGMASPESTRSTRLPAKVEVAPGLLGILR